MTFIHGRRMGRTVDLTEEFIVVVVIVCKLYVVGQRRRADYIRRSDYKLLLT